MSAKSKLYPLNAKAIKTTLKKEGVKVYSCKKGTGSSKNATYIYVDYSDAEYSCDLLKNIGVIDCLGNPISIMGKITKKEGVCSLGACYMDEQTYIEVYG